MAKRVGILYESDEWSDWKLHRELEAALGRPVAMINMEADNCLDAAAECEVLVSCVFASAVFRGHEHAAASMNALVHGALPESVELINPRRAHGFEVSKAAAAQALEAAGLTVPPVLGLGRPEELRGAEERWRYPCVIKPDCGGRTTHTAVLHDASQAVAFLEEAPDLRFIVEEFIPARAGFMTRMELVDGALALVVKRSIAPNGLSSYHEGSTYELYPDCPEPVREAVRAAAAALDIQFGSFDVIEGADGRTYLIDANSVSNVSEDCTELFGGLDLMGCYAEALARRIDGKA
ncbi:hypothetical protein PZH32_02485 [Adlercreutzia equolifaciens]|uniref:ATP-grasp domain-containing protein n=1 Tax=Adlercreutzia equolifaciens TaxID=446660 RepID=UPI0023B19CDF|nr:hypothetical protein [Adlercreutzia equolifaciens]MDE8701826.1 hypothetical protein [Adlercreutzia equolifaciens]